MENRILQDGAIRPAVPTGPAKPAPVHHLVGRVVPSVIILPNATPIARIGRESNAMIKCPKCASTAVGHIRMDCDWGSGGDWSKANDGGDYTDQDIKAFNDNERPDIDCYICCMCNTHFEGDCLPNLEVDRAKPAGDAK